MDIFMMSHGKLQVLIVLKIIFGCVGFFFPVSSEENNTLHWIVFFLCGWAEEQHHLGCLGGGKEDHECFSVARLFYATWPHCSLMNSSVESVSAFAGLVWCTSLNCFDFVQTNWTGICYELFWQIKKTKGSSELPLYCWIPPRHSCNRLQLPRKRPAASNRTEQIKLAGSGTENPVDFQNKRPVQILFIKIAKKDTV